LNERAIKIEDNRSNTNSMGGLIVGIILILIGISVLTGVSIGSFIVAIVLIAIGIRIIAHRSVCNAWHSHDHDHHHRPSSDEMSIDEVAIFSPLNKTIVTENFKGGKIVMVFSGGEINLTQAKTEGAEIHLEVASVFSGVEITVPKDWKVKSNANVFLGGVDIHQAQGGDSNVTLIIHGDAVFGEIEVRK
jgi:predicted membrane protein